MTISITSLRKNRVELFHHPPIIGRNNGNSILEVIEMTTNIHILWRNSKGQQHVDAPCFETVDQGTETLYPLRRKDKILAVGKCLPKKSFLRLVGDHSGEMISCLIGVVWITQSGDPQDILVCAGESFTIGKKGTIVIQGLVETRLKIISPRWPKY